MIVYIRKNVWLEGFINLFPTFNAEAIGGWVVIRIVGWVERKTDKKQTLMPQDTSDFQETRMLKNSSETQHFITKRWFVGFRCGLGVFRVS